MTKGKRKGRKKGGSGEQMDNVATPGAPVWRRRLRKPFTCWAVRAELLSQAAELSDRERQLYVRRRLTDLDKALDDDEAEALERWLDCEDMLQGRVKISDYGDRTGGGSGQASPVPDRVIMAMEAHAWAKRGMPAHMRAVLLLLGRMMETPAWDYAAAGRLIGGYAEDRVAQKRFIEACRNAAAYLANMRTKKR